jgi:hypothetical protein
VICGRLLNFVCAVSLLLCVVVSLLWARSYQCIDDISYSTAFAPEPRRLLSSSGQLAWISYSGDWGNDGRLMLGLRYLHSVHKPAGHLSTMIGAIPVDWAALGFAKTWLSFTIPYWAVMALCAILPTAWILAISRRLPSSGCAACSYNLTGNTSGVCPECGTAVSQKSEPVA